MRAVERQRLAGRVGPSMARWFDGFARELLNMPEMRTFIQEKLQPEYVGSALLAIAVITVIARLRTLRSEG